MRNYVNILFNKDRKKLYIILSIVIVFVLTLTVVYAALSTTLNINGNAEVTAASWDIYLDNIQLNSSSATTTAPTISNKTTASFSTILSKPGDFYEFTIDVVNNGSIDAMIDSITKTPELTETQAKYLNYIVEYQNGESITTKQLVEKKSFVRLKVKIEFRKNITASDIPTTSETLNLSFTVNYVQADTTGTNVTDNGIWTAYKIISGDLNTVGSEIAIGDEHFYLMSSDATSITMFAKYNLYAGGVFNNGWTAYGDEATGRQDSTMLGGITGQRICKGVTSFAPTPYWENVTRGTFVYNSNSTIYPYIENYKTYLESQGVVVQDARPIKLEELETLGCDISSESCSSAPEWLYSTLYWTGAAYIADQIYYVSEEGELTIFAAGNVRNFGIRPVIKISI